MPSKWKLQRSYPTICELTPEVFNWIDPIEGPMVETKFIGCVFITVWDILLPPGTRIHTIASVERVCNAHAVGTPVVNDKLLWQDGNWKDHDRYIQYQKDWFLNLLVKQWNARKVGGLIDPNEPLMEELLPFRVEPTTPGSVTAPPAAEITDMERLFNWNIENDARLGDTLEIIQTETLEKNTQALATHVWSLAGDSRLLTINPNQGLNANTTNKIQADVDVQFGPGKVVIES